MEYYTDENIYPRDERMLIQSQVCSQKGVHLCGYKNQYLSQPYLSFIVQSQTVEDTDYWV